MAGKGTGGGAPRVQGNSGVNPQGTRQDAGVTRNLLEQLILRMLNDPNITPREKALLDMLGEGRGTAARPGKIDPGARSALESQVAELAKLFEGDSSLLRKKAQLEAKAQASLDAEARKALQKRLKGLKLGQDALTQEEAERFKNRLMGGESLGSVGSGIEDLSILKNMLGGITMPSHAPKYTVSQKESLERMAESGASMDELKLMMARYDMVNAYANGDAEALKGLEDGTMEEYIRSLSDKVAAGKASEEALRQQGLEKAVKNYAMPAWMQFLQAAALGVGEAASAAGNISQSYSSKLAQAMINAANSGTPGMSSQRKAAFGDPLEGAGYLGTAKALKQQHIGDRNKMIGDTINRILRGVTGQLGAEQQMQRQYRSLIEQRPPGHWYQTNWNLYKNSQFGPGSISRSTF